MKTAFKKGDKVILITNKQQPIESQSWSVKAGLKVGETYTIRHDQINSECWIGIEESRFTHPASKFILKPDCIIVLFRRKEDYKAIDKFLASKGYNPSNGPDIRRDESRIRVVHLRGSHAGETTYNGPVRYDCSAKEAIRDTEMFQVEYFGHQNWIVIRTKPSVKQAINQIKKYI